MSIRYILYVRKSSESEERQELSLPAQIRELTELARRRGLLVIGEPREEARSAKAPGRPVFQSVLRDLETGRAQGIICWKLDRLARNPKDGGDIMWSLSQGAIREIVTPERTYTGTGDDKMLMSIMFGMATKYSDDLSVNVKRGNREAILSGRWPCYPKLGYLRDRDTMRLVADPERFPIVCRIFAEVLAGTPPLQVYLRALHTWNLTTPRHGSQGGKPIIRSAFYRMLRDEFYTGIMLLGGERFPGTHPPALSSANFRRLQALLARRSEEGVSRPKRLFFPYRGIIRCGTCDSLATARTIVKPNGRTYTYYHCFRKDARYGICPEPAVEESVVERELAKFFGSIRLPDVWLQELLRVLDRLVERCARTSGKEKEARERRLEEINRRRAKLRRLLIDELLTPDEYRVESESIRSEEDAARAALDDIEDPDSHFQPLRNSAELLNSAEYLFAGATPEEKAVLVRATTFNLRLTGKTVLIEAKNLFRICASQGAFPSMWAWIGHVETTLLIERNEHPSDRGA